MKNDIEFTIGDGIFNQRSAILIFNSHGSLLVQRKLGQGSTSWAVPGGKIKFGESSYLAIRREIFEELGLVFEEIRLKCICEHKVQLFGTLFHQTIFLYTLKEIVDFVEPTDPSLEFRWAAEVEFDELKPTWLNEVLHSQKNHHIFDMGHEV